MSLASPREVIVVDHAHLKTTFRCGRQSARSKGLLEENEWLLGHDDEGNASDTLSEPKH